MLSKKKTEQPIVDTSTSTAPDEAGPENPASQPAEPGKAGGHSGVDGSPVEPEKAERASAYQSDHFSLRFEGRTALLSPVNWVGPAPFQFPEDRVAELHELLGRAL